MSVYLMASSGYIKVGYSADPIARSESVTRFNRPTDVDYNAPVEVIGWFPGQRDRERQAHMDLGAHWVMGEWFVDKPEVRAYLKAQDDAVVMDEMSAAAVFAVQAGLSVADAMAKYPLAIGGAEDVLDAWLRGEVAS